MRQTVVLRIGGQKGLVRRLTRCFSELEIGSQQRIKLANSLNASVIAPDPSTMATSPMTKPLSPKVWGSPGGSFKIV